VFSYTCKPAAPNAQRSDYRLSLRGRRASGVVSNAIYGGISRQLSAVSDIRALYDPIIDSIQGCSVRKLLCVPVFVDPSPGARGQSPVIGALTLINRRNDADFTVADEDMLSGVAAMVSSCANNDESLPRLRSNAGSIISKGGHSEAVEVSSRRLTGGSDISQFGSGGGAGANTEAGLPRSRSIHTREVILDTLRALTEEVEILPVLETVSQAARQLLRCHYFTIFTVVEATNELFVEVSSISTRCQQCARKCCVLQALYVQPCPHPSCMLFTCPHSCRISTTWGPVNTARAVPQLAWPSQALCSTAEEPSACVMCT